MSLREKLATIGTKKQNSILSASLVLGVTFAISAILGLFRSKFLYAHFFNCCVLDLDAYNAAFRLPDLIFKLLVTGALSASFIPVFTGFFHKNKKKAYEMSSVVITLLLIIFSFVALIVLIFTNQFSRLIAPGFTDYQIGLMSGLTRILLIAQIFFLISNFFTGILQVHQVFLIPALSPIVYNIFIILGILCLAPSFGIYGVVYGAVIGAFFHLAIQFPLLKKLGFHYHFSFNYKTEGVYEVIRLMLPRSLSLGLGEIGSTVTLFFASTLTAGSLSLLNLAMQLIYLPSRIFSTTVGQASLPILSKNVARNEMHLFRNTVRRTITQGLFITIPITALVLIHRFAIVRIAFGAKQFPWSATIVTARTLAYLTPVIICQSIIQILIRSFYALHDTKTPLRLSVISLSCSILACYLLVNYTNFGIIGLAISDSLGNMIQCLGLFYVFVRRVDGGGWNKTFIHITKIIMASFLLAFSSWSALRFIDLFIFDTTRTFYLVLTTITAGFVGLIVFFISAKLMKIEEYNSYRHYFIKTINFLTKH
jgi:putative peptidoglycan lipid II flippase